MKNIEILYEDNSLIIVNKPAGLAVQGGKGVKTSLDKLLPALLVHRLDKDTSGVLLTAKGQEAASNFSRILGRGSPSAVKMYIAVCKDKPEKDEGVIKDELLIRGKVKKSETRYRVIYNGTLPVENMKYSVLELELGTGRMHQIRRHLAMNGNPVLGDDKYGDFPLNKKLYREMKLKRLLLHASRLIIRENNIDIHAPLPEYFKPFMPS
ncbi:MAG: RluA family pseudouridine synthase [Treponema sp.]|nr:RluA family pseudouridine synthase [Treponema sp.]